MNNQSGQIRVGRTKGANGPHPSYPGFKRVICLMSSSPYYNVSPYALQDSKGRILENIWQFSKYYLVVPKSLQRYSRYNKRVIWDHPAEIHHDDYNPNEAYLDWRKKGMNNNEAVRYPVGYKYRSRCVCAYKELENGPDLEHPLNYITSRKEIYLPIYREAVEKTEMFLKLKKRLENGENLLIIEVDGPHEESMDYYKEKYDVGDDFIQGNTISATPENMELLLNDEKHNFGHGYCLAMALLDMKL